MTTYTISLSTTEAVKVLEMLQSMSNAHRVQDYAYWLTKAGVSPIVVDTLQNQLEKAYRRLYANMKHSGRCVFFTLEAAEHLALETVISNIIWRGAWRREHFALTSHEVSELMARLAR